MKLVYPEIQTVFQFGNGNIPAIIIENANLFYRFTDDLYRQCNGENGEAVLSCDDAPVSISGNLELFTNYFLCNLIGTWVENGEYPADMEFLSGLVEDICANNAKRYFNL